GAIDTMGDAEGTWTAGLLRGLARTFKVPLDVPWKKLPAKTRQLVLYGGGDEKVKYEFRMKKGSVWEHEAKWKGVIPELERRYRSTSSDAVRKSIGALMNPTPCPECGGLRPKPATLAGKGGGRNTRRGEARCARGVRGPALHRRAGHDRSADPQGAARPARLPRGRGPRLPDARSHGGLAGRRRGPAHPARDADRLAAHGRALHPGRALDRP